MTTQLKIYGGAHRNEDGRIKVSIDCTIKLEQVEQLVEAVRKMLEAAQKEQY